MEQIQAMRSKCLKDKEMVLRIIFPTAGLCFVFPILMRASYFLVNVWYQVNGINHKYMDSECILKMVNTTNPIHFSKHPVWPKRGYESDCDINAYYRYNIEGATFESRILKSWTLLGLLIGIIGCYMQLPDWRKLLPYSLVALVGAECSIITAHYQSDITHRGGATEHHANMHGVEPLERDHFATYGTSVRTLVPHLACIVFASFLPCVVGDDNNAYATGEQMGVKTYNTLLAKWRRFLCARTGFQAYLKVNLLVHTFWVVFAPLVMHKYMHDHDKSILPDWLENLLQTYDHMLYHHGTAGTPVEGLSFGSSARLGYLHDNLLLNHGNIYSNGWVHRSTFLECILDYVVDVFLFWIMFYYLCFTDMLIRAVSGACKFILATPSRNWITLSVAHEE